jgi:hypothetical protein
LFILRKFFGKDSGDAEYNEYNKKRQLIYVGSHMSDRVKTDMINQFPEIDIVQSSQTFKVPKSLVFTSVHLETDDQELETLV